MQQQSWWNWPCGLCRTLRPTEQELAPHKPFQSDYGTPTDLKARQECPICRLILKMLPSDGPTIPNTGATATQSSVLIVGYDGRLNDGIRVFYDGTYRGFITLDPPVNAFSETSSLRISLIKDWIMRCENHHKDDGFTLAPRYKHPVEIILIDVLDQKLVRASSSWRFLTISYVWGNAALGTTNTANRRAREEQGALSKVHLPQLILDAMLFASKLGERYL
jgi:hypothetical protein